MEDKPNNQTSDTGKVDLDFRQPGTIAQADRLPKLLLASSSPRRSEILRIVGWPFETAAADIDESLKPGEPARVYVERLALEKAKAVAARHDAPLVLGADTTVVIDGRILAKPEDTSEARQMLALLQGRWHQVLTGVALVSGECARVALENTEVQFAAMSADEIDWYAATGEPMDKAGAYAIQGKGARFIKGIRGDYFNVMGLPLRLVYELVTAARAVQRA